MSAGVPSPLPGPLDGGTLERRYRRLLGLYPPSWRAGRLEEVLAVLLACAEPDRKWPALRDGADLVRHALGERVRLAGRSVSSDDRRSGIALAGIVAFALLSALSMLQLIVLVPNPDAWAAAGYRFFSSGPALAMLASALCLVAGGLWLARIRRLAIAAMALGDACLLLAALALRNSGSLQPWPLIIGILGLAAAATVLVSHRGLSEAARGLIGVRGAFELVGALVLAAEIAQWRYIAWGSSVYGPFGFGSPNYDTIPQALTVAFLVAAAGALLVAPRNPVPLIAATVLSPLLLAGAIAASVQAWVFGNAYVAVHLATDAIPLGVVALLALASALAVRRSAPG